MALESIGATGNGRNYVDVVKYNIYDVIQKMKGQKEV